MFVCVHVCVLRVKGGKKERGQGVKEVRFNHREVKIDDKSDSAIIPSYYKMSGRHLLLLSLTRGTILLVGMR